MLSGPLRFLADWVKSTCKVCTLDPQTPQVCATQLHFCMGFLAAVQYCQYTFSSLRFSQYFLVSGLLLVQIQYKIHVTWKICDDQLFMLPGRLRINSRLLLVKFLESQKLYLDSDGSWGVGAPTPVWFMGQLCMLKRWPQRESVMSVC